MKVTEGRPNLSVHTGRSSLVRQLRQKVKLNLKVILVGSGVYLHLNVFDLPSSKALLRQTGGGNYAQLQVSVSPFLFNSQVAHAWMKRTHHLKQVNYRLPW